MSAETIKEFLVGLGFKVDEAGLAKFSEGIASASLRVTALAAATTAAAGAIVAGVQKIAADFDQLDKLATQFRTTADAIDEFADAAGILGIKKETAVEGLKNLDRAIVDTSMDMGRAKAVFADLGISVKDAAGNLKPTTEVMAELAEKFKGMEKGKQIRVMERLGLDPSLLKLFNADMVALRAEMEAIDKAAGLDFGQAMAESKAFMEIWRAMQQEIQKWKLLFKTTMESVSVKLMPKFRAQIRAITDAMINFRRKVMDNLPKAIEAIMPIINVIMRIAEAFIKITARIASGAMTIIGWFLKLNEATGGWAGYILAAAAAWKYLNLAFLKTPLGMLLALAAAVALLIDDFLTFKEGGDSLIDWGSGFGVVMQAVTAALTGFLAYVVLSKAAVVAMAVATKAWTAATVIFNGIMAAARMAVLLFNLMLYANPIGLVIAAIVALGAAVVGMIVYWDEIKAYLIGFFDWFVSKVDFLPGVIGSAFGAAKDSVIGIFTGVKDWFTGFFDWIGSKFQWIAEWGSKVKGFFGGGSNAAPALAPSPQAQAAINGGGQNVNQQTQIVVQGSSDPAATARAVSGEQGRVNADMARNMRGAAR
jgi:hypothetical protein